MLPLLLALALACPSVTPLDPAVDGDGDGFTPEQGDCDDTDPSARPDAEESCNGADDDCDGAVDEGLEQPFYPDADGDGWGDSTRRTEACTAPDGHTARGGDCDDGRDEVSPVGQEVCNGRDDDCDGVVDEASAADAATWYVDADADGFGDPEQPARACDAPASHVSTGTDCDDADPAAWPGALEIPDDGVDQSCDGFDGCADLDCDGWPDLVFPALHTTATDGWGDTRIYHGARDGFAGQPPTSLPRERTSVALTEDLDADGFTDLVLASSYTGESCDTTALLCWGSPDGLDLGGCQQLPIHSVSRSVVTGDLDLDGHLDLVFPAYCDDAGGFEADTLIYWGSEAGFSEPDVTALPASGALDATIADLDRNGWPDLVLASHYDGHSWAVESYVYWGSVVGFDRTDRTALPVDGATDVVARDLDADGWPDLAFAAYFDDVTWETASPIFWGSADGFHPDRRTDLPTKAAVHLEVADLDLNGWPDLAVANYGASPTTQVDSSVWWNGPGGISPDDRTDLPTNGAYDTRTADMDLDAWPDLVFSGAWGTTALTDSYIYWGSAAGFTATDRTALPGSSAFHLEVVDLDTDGIPEVVLACYFDGSDWTADSYVYWGAEGWSVEKRDVLPTVGAWGVVGVAGP